MRGSSQRVLADIVSLVRYAVGHDDELAPLAELAPQDPDDEPASALLERIRAGREAEGRKDVKTQRVRERAAQ